MLRKEKLSANDKVLPKSVYNATHVELLSANASGNTTCTVIVSAVIPAVTCALFC